ncbi:MAG: ATP synthase F1 subunit gamma [Candidatus Omnitrophica bacterium]|nr:ATP synthase F1 subunit gamma [Candidatus Omnitrophota bacterium]
MIGIKEFNKKIASLKNTRKLTTTMKMVSASKFKKAFKAQTNAQAYSQKLNDLIKRLSLPTNHPLIKQKADAPKILVVLFTSDKGLCGGFNNNLIRKTRSWISDLPAQGPQVDMSFCGRRGYMSFRRSAPINKYYEHITVKPDFSQAFTLAQDITDLFMKGQYKEIYLAYNRFKGPLSQVPCIEKILPLDLSEIVTKEGPLDKADQARGYSYEPPEEEIFAFLIPKFLNFKVFYILLENAAGEHGARMSAMDKASQNTADLIDRYIMRRNRARQAGITTELNEIISGAEAIK